MQEVKAEDNYFDKYLREYLELNGNVTKISLIRHFSGPIHIPIQTI
jgi:hypothetical protein